MDVLTYTTASHEIAFHPRLWYSKDLNDQLVHGDEANGQKNGTPTGGVVVVVTTGVVFSRQERQH